MSNTGGVSRLIVGVLILLAIVSTASIVSQFSLLQEQRGEREEREVLSEQIQEILEIEMLPK